jgi:hypothetical protein
MSEHCLIKKNTPDLGNQLTAIALQDDGRMFKKLKLVRE